MGEVERMGKYLKLIRSSAGWTAKDLGDRIGVTRQTINNIEAGRSKLTKTEYIAIRSVIDDEIGRFGPEETRMLIDLLDLLIDNPEKYDKEQKEKLLSYATTMEASITSGSAKRAEVSKRWNQIVEMLGYVLLGVGLYEIYSDCKNNKNNNSWLAKIINNKK